MSVSVYDACMESGKAALLSQWDSEKNLGMDIHKITAGSGKKAWWKCEKGHSWDAAITSRIRLNAGCPYCSGLRAIPGETDLATVAPELAAQWHPTKNEKLMPTYVKLRSSRQVWWLCREGHAFQASVSNRASGNGCPICSSRKVLPGYNDLKTKRPELAAQWHPQKNGVLLPEDLMPQSNRKVWWLCSKGHEWQAGVNHRYRGSGCPVCSNRKVLPGFNDLATTNPMLAAQWHPEKNGALTPQDVAACVKRKIWWLCSKGHEWQANLLDRYKGSGCPVCAVWKRQKSFQNLNMEHPELAVEWDREKNGGLAFGETFGGSKKKVWWRCKRGHTWEATLSNRIRGSGCPVCAGRTVLPGFNDLATLRPELTAQWHPHKNGALTPDQVTVCSGRKVWWCCEKGHAWPAVIAARSAGGGCPICSGKQVLAGYNDLATVCPEVAAQWHPEKNGTLIPQMVTGGSRKQIWWVCKRGHEWKTTVASRVSGCGCPRCNPSTSFAEQAIYFYLSQHFAAYNRYRFHGRELDVYIPECSAAVEHDGPFHELEKVKRADEKKNTLLRAHGIYLIRVKEGNGYRVDPENGIIWYRYNVNHYQELEQAIEAVFRMLSFRTGKQYAVHIDVCRDQRAIHAQYMLEERKNSLFQKTEEARQFWNYEKNRLIEPELLSYRSNKKVWWRCEKGHEWEAAVAEFSVGSRCPYCSGHRVLAGFNDLASRNPLLAAQWHPTHNGNLTPDQVTIRCGKKVWWRCEKGHEWQACVASRTAGSGCAVCSGKRILAGENDLATTHPALAAQWHPERNSGLSPDRVSAHSPKRVWWLCSCGHEWQRIIRARAGGSGCPHCGKS